jgi:hypothetical protein
MTEAEIQVHFRQLYSLPHTMANLSSFTFCCRTKRTLMLKVTIISCCWLRHSWYGIGGDYGSALMAALHNKKRDIAVRLLDAGANVHLTGKDGLTALYFAALEGDNHLVQLLLRGKPNVDAHGKDDFFPLAPMLCS